MKALNGRFRMEPRKVGVCLAKINGLFRGTVCFPWLVALLAAMLAFVADPAVVAAQPTREELRRAELIGEAFGRGQTPLLEPWLAPSLKARLAEGGLEQWRADLEAIGGALRHVQAAYAVPAPQGAEMAVVPLDLEGGAVDLMLAWRGDLNSGALMEMQLRPRQPRPQRQNPAHPQFEFRDAPYVQLDRVEQREFRFGEAPYPLVGRLAVPQQVAAGAFPAVLLLGEADMTGADGQLGPNRPLRDLALGLASRGIATLRFERRGQALPGTIPQEATLEDTILQDAVAAVQALRSTRGIDPARVAVLGFGHAGFLAPSVAERGGAAGVIILGATAEPRAAAALRERRALSPAAGGPTEDQVAQWEADLRSLQDGVLLPGTAYLGWPASWWESWDTVRPGDVLARWGGAALYLAGERDFLLRKEDLQVWSAAMAGHPARAMQVLPGLNRWFMVPQFAGRPEERSVPGHVAPAVLNRLESFLLPQGPVPRSTPQNDRFPRRETRYNFY